MGATTGLFDEQDAASIGAIAIAPSADSVIWVGTGDAFPRSSDRETDGGGNTWERVLFVDESTGGVDVVMDPEPAGPLRGYVANVHTAVGPLEWGTRKWDLHVP